MSGAELAINNYQDESAWQKGLQTLLSDQTYKIAQENCKKLTHQIQENKAVSILEKELAI